MGPNRYSDKDIPDRVSIDDTKNSRGTGFLKSVNYCMLSGHITPDLDNFSCISHKGRSVVDYLFVRHESILNINQFSVSTVTDLCLYFKYPSGQSNARSFNFECKCDCKAYG